MRRRRRLGLAAVGVLLAVAGAAYWVGTHWPPLPWSAAGWGARPFSSADWWAAKGTPGDTRATMLRSLLRSRPLVGKTPAEIVALLGPPDSSGGDWCEYVLGMRSGFGIDYDGLILEFGPDDRVRRWQVVQH